MRYLSPGEVVDLHRRVPQTTGGASGIRDFGVLESAIAQAKATFDGVEFYPTLNEKAAALAFSLVLGHPFVDGNKRAGHAATETFLVLTGPEIDAPVDDQEHLMLDLAAGRIGRDQLSDWPRQHLKPLAFGGSAIGPHSLKQRSG
jgi:death-on-curing protein